MSDVLVECHLCRFRELKLCTKRGVEVFVGDSNYCGDYEPALVVEEIIRLVAERDGIDRKIRRLLSILREELDSFQVPACRIDGE